MRVLVTGGAGFFGSHIVDALRARGDDVLVLDDLSTGDRANLDPAVRLVVADISDRERVRGMLAGERLDAVIHAAAKTKVVESISQPALYRRVIVDGTSNALDVAQLSGARSFVNISTGGALYGETPACATEENRRRNAADVSDGTRYTSVCGCTHSRCGLTSVQNVTVRASTPRARTRDIADAAVAKMLTTN